LPLAQSLTYAVFFDGRFHEAMLRPGAFRCCASLAKSSSFLAADKQAASQDLLSFWQNTPSLESASAFH